MRLLKHPLKDPSVFSTRRHWFAADQKNNSPFEDPEAIQRPSGENATVYTKPVCASNRRISFPVCTSQSRTALSAPAEAIRRLSGENATLYTSNVWGFNRQISLAVRTSQSRTVLSAPPRGDQEPVRRERHAPHNIRMPFESPDLLASLRIPEQDDSGNAV